LAGSVSRAVQALIGQPGRDDPETVKL